MESLPTPQKPVYVFQLPVRIWHWSLVLAIAILVPTGFIIGKPWHSLDGDPTHLFYMGYTKLVHFSAGFVLLIGLLCRIVHAFFGNAHSREIFVLPFWRKAWRQDLLSDVRWYFFLDRSPRVHAGHNPLAQLGMGACVAFIGLMILTGFGLFSANSGLAVLRPFGLVMDAIYALGGNGQTLHSLHRLGMFLLLAFIVVHLYMVIREEIMGRTSLVTTMFNGFRYVRSGKGG